MNLAELQAMGAFVPTKPVKREVKVKQPLLRAAEEWSDADVPEYSGEHSDATITTYIRRGAAIDAIEMMKAEERLQPFVAIHRSIVNEDGSPLFLSIEQASQLALWVAIPLFEAITEVAGSAPKALRRKRSGG